MATTRLILTPFSADLPNSGYPELSIASATYRRGILKFDASSAENCYWSFVAPQGISTTLTVVLTYYMASATTNGVAFAAAIEAISDGDSLDVDSAESFDTENVNYETVPGTQGYISQISISLTTYDSMAAGDMCRLKFGRRPDNANDTASGDACVLCVELRDG